MSRNKELNRGCYNRIKESLLGEAITPWEEVIQIKENPIVQVSHYTKGLCLIAQVFFIH